MGKSAIRSVAWHAPTASYQINKQANHGTVATPVNDERAAWNAWLERVSSFAFQSRDGCHLTVLKEQRGHGRAYWTAYRSVGGKLKRKYLGASTRVTLARLEQAAAALTASKTATAAAYPLPPKDSSFTVECDQHRTPWQASFVATKFFVPTPSRTLISRPRLVALLMEGFTQKLTLVSAPAGFGKTTLVSAWVRSLPKDHAQVAWVSLDSRDNEPICFWTAVLTALEQRAPGIGRAALTLLHAQPSLTLEYVLATLINRLSETTTPWVLLLDDYQVISKPAIHAQLLYLVEHQPSHVHLLLLSRSDPPLSLPRLRARGEILEVGAEELRATVEETAAYLSDVMGIRLPEAVVSELTARTEGWLVGLQLVGLSLQRSANPATMLEEVRGSQRYILDYLVEEVLQQQPPAVQRFLLRTSILEEFCAPLCDAVVGKPQGHQSSQQVLEELERANVFVVPLDEHRQWYRYLSYLPRRCATNWSSNMQTNSTPCMCGLAPGMPSRATPLRRYSTRSWRTPGSWRPT
jgi:AAA ATPase domain